MLLKWRGRFSCRIALAIKRPQIAVAVLICGYGSGDFPVNEDHGKGMLDKAKGAIKETVGKVTGSEKLQAEGKADKAEGTAHEKVGDVKDAAGKITDTFKR